VNKQHGIPKKYAKGEHRQVLDITRQQHKNHHIDLTSGTGYQYDASSSQQGGASEGEHLLFNRTKHCINKNT
jgi:hypothetical protein